MEKRDYILREIEKIAFLIRFLLGKILSALTIVQQEEVYEQVDRELKLNLDMDIESILHLPRDQFDNAFKENNGFNIENLELLANLFHEMAQVKEEKKKLFLMKSLELNNYIGEKSKAFSFEREAMKNRIIDELEHL